MAAVALSTLRTRVRERADQEATTFVTDTELRTFINQSWRKLYDFLLQTHADHFTVGPSASFALTSSTPTKDLTTISSTFYKLRGVEKQVAGDWVAVPRIPFRERNDAVFTGYVLVAKTLRIYPTDDADGNYRVWYLNAATELSADVDTIDAPNGAEELVVIDAAIKCNVKAAKNVMSLRDAYEQEKERIEESAYDADASDPPRVSDVRGAPRIWEDWLIE